MDSLVCFAELGDELTIAPAPHLSLTLDGPVKNGKFMAKAVMKTDLGDPMLQDCLLKRN